MLERTTKPKSSSRKYVAIAVSVLLILGVCLVLIPSQNRTQVSKKFQPQVVNKPYVVMMGTDALNKAYNIFKGQGADPEVARSIGVFTTTQLKKFEYGGTVYFEPDQVDVTMNAQCFGQTTNEEVFEAYSTKAASSYASESTFQQDVSAKAGWKSESLWGGAGIKVEGGFDMTLAFGNSREMKQSKAMKGKKMTTAFNSYTQSTLYEAFVDWTPFYDFKFNPNFLAAVKALNDPYPNAANRQKRVMEFFERYGTHVIREASFGSKCTMTTFMEENSRQEDVSRFVSEAGSSQFSLGVWLNVASGGASFSSKSKTQSSKAYKETSQTSGSFGSGRKYEVSNIYCQGAVVENVCNRKLNGEHDNPVMISYDLFPIWKIAGAGFTPFALKAITDTVTEFRIAFDAVVRGQCKTGGAPTVKDSFWEIISSGQYNGGFGSAFSAECIPKANPNFLGNPQPYRGQMSGMGDVGFQAYMRHRNPNDRYQYLELAVPHWNPECAHPRVVGAFRGFAIDKNFRQQLRIRELPTTGNRVAFNFQTWGDTIPHHADFAWFKTCNPNFVTGLFHSTGHLKPGLTKGPVWHPHFPPGIGGQCVKRYWAAFSMFEIPSHRDMRVWAHLTGDWVRVDTWGDSEIYGAEMMYISWCENVVGIEKAQTGELETPRPQHREQGPLASGSGDRFWQQTITFHRIMHCHPRVFVAFTGLHMWDQRQLCVRVNVVRSDARSVTFEYKVWGDCIAFHLKIKWMAYCH